MLFVRDAFEFRAIGLHHVHIPIVPGPAPHAVGAIPMRPREHDPRAVRREGRVPVAHASGVCQLPDLLAVQVPARRLWFREVAPRDQPDLWVARELLTSVCKGDARAAASSERFRRTSGVVCGSASVSCQFPACHARIASTGYSSITMLSSRLSRIHTSSTNSL